jgi:hypothetical protein
MPDTSIFVNCMHVHSVDMDLLHLKWVDLAIWYFGELALVRHTN